MLMACRLPGSVLEKEHKSPKMVWFPQPILCLCTLKGEPDLTLPTLAPLSCPHFPAPPCRWLLWHLGRYRPSVIPFTSFYCLLLCGLTSNLWFLKCENPALGVLRSPFPISGNGEFSRLSRKKGGKKEKLSRREIHWMVFQKHCPIVGLHCMNGS